ncbi:MAG: FCD domain-containing protein [Bacteroidia bacterium]|nr:FCD domain-containing protein [Bacteroidia bacterium]
MIIKTSDMVIKYILDLITKGDIKPNDKLPSAEALAKLTGTSIISAREAVQNLATIGLLNINHGRGIFMTGGGEVIEKLLEARKAIESYNASMAAQHISGSQLEDIKKLLTLMDEDVKRGDVESFGERDFEFHILIGKASENIILLRTLENIKGLLRYQVLSINKVPGNMEKASDHHWKLFRAISKKDSDSANLIMIKHIDTAIAAWKKYNEMIHGKKEGSQDVSTH